MSVPVTWIVTSNPANLALAPVAELIGVPVERDVAGAAHCEWAAWGPYWILVTTRETPGLADQYDAYWDKVPAHVAERIEQALAALVS